MRLSLSSQPLYYILFDPILLSFKEKPMKVSLIEPQKDLYSKAWKTMKIPLLWDRGTTQKEGRETKEKNMWRSKRGWTYQVQSKEKGSKSLCKRKEKWKELKELSEIKRKRTW